MCAFTDDGLTQKSFLCPESTLFDQTILKCNWWFYVDCKSSKKLYDSNIPVSKSYQLMKALTFFSSYSAGPGDAANDGGFVSSSPPPPPPQSADHHHHSAAQSPSTVAPSTAAGVSAASSEVLDDVSFKKR